MPAVYETYTYCVLHLQAVRRTHRRLGLARKLMDQVTSFCCMWFTMYMYVYVGVSSNGGMFWSKVCVSACASEVRGLLVECSLFILVSVVIELLSIFTRTRLGSSKTTPVNICIYPCPNFPPPSPSFFLVLLFLLV